MQIQLIRPDEPGLCKFVEPEIVDGDLVFKVETVRWNPATEENDPVSSAEYPAALFSQWWLQTMEDGWVVGPSL